MSKKAPAVVASVLLGIVSVYILISIASAGYQFGQYLAGL